MVSDEEALKLLEGGGMESGGIDQNSMSAQAYNNIQGQSDNLIVWQLELDNILERIEHLLKGDIISEDGQGGLTYTVPKDKRLIVLNSYGVGLIMNFISFYLNRNTILSNYREERVYEILHTLGHELGDLVYINYEQMGLDTVEKKSRAFMLIMNILHMIESAYNRALGGEERDSLRKARIVTQSQPLGGSSIGGTPQGGFTLNPFKRLMGG